MKDRLVNFPHELVECLYFKTGYTLYVQVAIDE